MPRVLMTADTVGGVWTYALDLCRALAPHGVEVALATMGAAPTADQRRQVRALLNVTLHESTFKLEWMSEPWDDVRRAADWLLALERDFAPDVIHLNGYAHGALPWHAPVLIVGHSCVLSWWQAVKGADAPQEWDQYRDVVTAGLRAARLVVAPTRAMLQALVRHYGPLPESRVIHNGRDPSAYRPGPKEPFILSAGRLWDEAKNLAALDRIADRLPWPINVAGEVASVGAGTSAAARHVQPLGRLGERELAEQMARAAVYALPARYEPFGLSAVEAGLSGCALVLGDIDSLHEVWGDAALYVPPDDSGALFGALRRLAEQPAFRAEMGNRALARARCYTPQNMAQAYLSAYRDLCSAADVSRPVPDRSVLRSAAKPRVQNLPDAASRPQGQQGALCGS